MKSSRKRPASLPLEPTPGDQIRSYLQELVDQHYQAWDKQLQQAEPEWAHLLALHLRLVELENMEAALKEFV
ncbi:MAG TPA: hypothetical protein VN833_32900 [Candidatus Acidoferrales bacterium]|nr:hypothetical protein [Candidatus Acidoferrales bacterium]